MAESKKTVSGASPQDSLQPPTSARILNVVLETCREQRRLIKLLAQKTNQENLVTHPDNCFCCGGYDHPCLQDKEKDTLPVSVANHDVSIQYRQPLKYKMVTIPTLNLRLPPKELFVGVIKQHVTMMSSLTTDFPPFHSHLLLRSMEELKSRCFAYKACCIFKNLDEYCPM